MKPLSCHLREACPAYHDRNKLNTMRFQWSREELLWLQAHNPSLPYVVAAAIASKLRALDTGTPFPSGPPCDDSLDGLETGIT